MPFAATGGLGDVLGSLPIALAKAGVPYEAHIYPDGPHGLALANHITDLGKSQWNDPAIAKWVKMAAYWADHIKQN